MMKNWMMRMMKRLKKVINKIKNYFIQSSKKISQGESRLTLKTIIVIITIKETYIIITTNIKSELEIVSIEIRIGTEVIISLELTITVRGIRIKALTIVRWTRLEVIITIRRIEAKIIRVKVFITIVRIKALVRIKTITIAITIIIRLKNPIIIIIKASLIESIRTS